MLHLTRNVGESVLIADGTIKITITEIQGRQVKLSIDAPRDVDVFREELFANQEDKTDGTDFC